MMDMAAMRSRFICFASASPMMTKVIMASLPARVPIRATSTMMMGTRTVRPLSFRR